MNSTKHLLSVIIFIIALLICQCVSGQSNVVVILADDLDLELDGTSPLSKTRQLIAKEGAVFKNMYVTDAHNCPSRASLLSGMYAHNHGVINNSVSGGCSSQQWREKWEKLTIANLLPEYKTFFSGVYLDEYGKNEGGGTYIPEGWKHWKALVGGSAYYNYTLVDNGTPVFHYDEYSVDYFTDVVNASGTAAELFECLEAYWLYESTSVGCSGTMHTNQFFKLNSPNLFRRQQTPLLLKYIKNESVEFIKEVSAPFFMLIAPPACGAPFVSAPQYQSHFEKAKAPRTKSYNVPGKDKHWLVANVVHPMSNESVYLTDSILRKRWRTLLSLDDLVEAVVHELSAQSLLDNTYIFFTSDSGYHLGQFGLPNGNRQLYEFDTHVPLFVRGPTITAGTTIAKPVLTIDLAPTIVALANGILPSNMDGKPFLSKSSDHKVVKTREKFLILHHGEGHRYRINNCKQSTMNQTCCLPSCVCEDSFNNSYSCVRSISSSLNTVYCEFSDNVAFVELYDLSKDPFQLKNIASAANSTELLKYHNWLIELAMCKGTTCL